MASFQNLRTALNDAAMRELAVHRYVKVALGSDNKEIANQLALSAARVLEVFAGQSPDQQTDKNSATSRGGLQAVAAFLEANVPQAERERAGEVLVRILNGVLFELNQLAREREGLAPMQQSEATRSFMNQSVLSLSDSFFSRAPMTFMMEDFQQVQASVFQVSRAPGKTIVYLGCFFLIVGVFAMLYVRERRLWVWLSPAAASADGAEAAGGTHAILALSTNRKTMEVDKEFVQLKSRLLLLSS